MTASHSGVVFNHSCLKVPVNPLNKLPNPCYERKYLGGSAAGNHELQKKVIDFQQELKDRVLGDVHKKCLDVSKVNGIGCVTSSSNVIDSFVDFFSSIPDYSDINHLSDREFDIKVQDLREKQQSYVNALDKKICSDMPVTVSSNRSKKRQKNSPVSAGAPASMVSNVAHSAVESCFQNCNIKKNGLKSPVTCSGRKHYSTATFRSEVYPEEYKQKVFTKSVLSDTMSTVSVDKNSDRPTGKLVPSIHINNYVSDGGGVRSDINGNPKLCVVHEKSESLTSRADSLKDKAKKPTNGTNKVRDIHSASTVKRERATADTSSSLVDSMWDGFSVDYYFTKGRQNVSLDSDSGSEDGLPFVRSLPSSPVGRHSKTVAWKDPNITIPEPFEMTLRDEEERYMNYLMLLEEPRYEKEEGKQFRANPVPLTSRVPLYNQIMAKQEDRRRRVRKHCMAKLLSQMKPFSFVDRDDKMMHQRICCSTPDLRDLHQDSPKPFKARPVPKNLFSSYVYERMREDEFYRELKRRIRAEELLKVSSLPPSMAAREKLAKVQATCTDVLPSHSGVSRRRRRIPNYKQSHHALMKELQDKYDDNITTSPRPFHLETANRSDRKAARFMSPDSSSNSFPYEARSSPVYQKLRPRSALGLPLNRNNLAAVLRIQSARQRLERELVRQQEELRVQENLRARERLMRKNPVWHALAPSVQEDLAMRVYTRREEEQLRREEYHHFMERMLQRVRHSPTLFERQTMKKQKAKGRSSYNTVPVADTPDLYDEPEASHSEMSGGRSSKSTHYMPSSNVDDWNSDQKGRSVAVECKEYKDTQADSMEPENSKSRNKDGDFCENGVADGQGGNGNELKTTSNISTPSPGHRVDNL